MITMRKLARRLTLAETSPERSPSASNGSLSVLSLATNGRRAPPPVCGSSRWILRADFDRPARVDELLIPLSLPDPWARHRDPACVDENDRSGATNARCS